MTNTNKLPEDMPLTTIARHAIKLGAERDFEQWTSNIGKKAATFKGFQGIFTIPPKKGDVTNEYTTVFQFESMETLDAWMNSEARKTEVKRLGSISEEEMQLEHQEGIDFLFRTSGTPSVSPPKWKMAVVTWAAVFPGVVVLSQLFRGMFPTLNGVVTTLLVTLTLVPLLTWVLMPNLTKLLKKWLF